VQAADGFCRNFCGQVSRSAVIQASPVWRRGRQPARLFALPFVGSQPPCWFGPTHGRFAGTQHFAAKRAEPSALAKISFVNLRLRKIAPAAKNAPLHRDRIGWKASLMSVAARNKRQ